MDLSDLIVLYLEDEPLIALDIADALESFDFRAVIVAHNLTSAKRHVDDLSFDLAVLDINLGSNQTSLALGAALKRRGTKVLFASGNSARGPELIEQGYGFLMKPFGPDKLRAAIEQYLKQHPSMAQGRPA